jgi:sterol desaturase/sphingolipid hydroxylase (fatty acid hydroxylase superfamily)
MPVLIYIFTLSFLYVPCAVILLPQSWSWWEEYSSSSKSKTTSNHLHLFDDTLVLDSHRLGFALGGSIFLECIFWSAQGLLLMITRSPSLFEKFTIKKTHVDYPNQTQIDTALAELAVSHLARPFLLWLFYPAWVARGCMAATFPSLQEMCIHLIFSILIDDTLFYWSHRLLHSNKWLYQTVHKQHHEFKYSVGLAVEYAHPVEDIFSNTLPTVAGGLLLGSHPAIIFSYMSLKMWQSIDAHSGFELPFPLSPFNVVVGMDCAPAHDYHHSHNVGNFGGFFTFWDWFCGTDKSYKRHLSKQMSKRKELLQTKMQ